MYLNTFSLMWLGRSPVSPMLCSYKCALKADIAQMEEHKREINNFKLDALGIGGTALFDRIDKAFPLAEELFDSSVLEELVGE